MSPWLRVLEAYAVAALLRTPAFHRAVEKVAKNVHRIRHGLPREEPGGTQIDRPDESGFLGHFAKEVRTQIGGAQRKSEGGSGNAGVNVDSRAMSHGGQQSRVEKEAAKVDEESADAAWRDSMRNAQQPPKQGFLDAYMGAIKEQMGSGKKS